MTRKSKFKAVGTTGTASSRRKVTAPEAPKPPTPALVSEQEAMEGMDAAHSLGRMEGMFEGASKMREAINSCPIMAILQEVHKEVHRATRKHGPMNSPHEAHSVIEEEFDELWDEIKADRGRQQSARIEAIQVAAMAVRYVLDIAPTK